MGHCCDKRPVWPSGPAGSISRVKLSADDPRPASIQVADLLRREIKAGLLKPGQKVPSVRDLAERFGIAPMTAQSALKSLREDGWIFTRPGRGNFVRDTFPEDSADMEAGSEEYRAIMRQLDAMSAEMQRLGARLAEVEAVVQHPDPDVRPGP
jgi:GntR family transcriptional regulator